MHQFKVAEASRGTLSQDVDGPHVERPRLLGDGLLEHPVLMREHERPAAHKDFCSASSVVPAA